MKRLCVFAILVFSFCLATQPAIADTYSIVALSTDDYMFSSFDGVHLVLWTPSGDPGPTYYTFEYGNFLGATPTPPTFDITPPPVVPTGGGAGCSEALPTGTTIVNSVCGNGRYAFEGYLPGTDPTTLHYKLYEDSGDGLTLLTGLDIGPYLFMDVRGDLIWEDELTDEWYEAVDLTTTPVPEPSSLALLGTGLIGIAAAARRRLMA